MMVRKNIKRLYRNSWLGVFWTVLNPLLNMFVMVFVFSSFFGRNVDYPTYLLSGYLTFNFMRGATTQSLSSIVDNRGLINKVKISNFLFPAADVLTDLVSYGFSFIALLIVIVARGMTIHLTTLFVPVYLISLVLFSLGIGMVLSAMYVYFRDIRHLYGVFCTLWMYMTPLFWTLKTMSEKVQFYVRFNPMYWYVEVFRTLMLDGRMPDANALLLCFGMGIASIVTGSIIFHFGKRKFILYI
jgi:ABC-2 type transport system permease protein